MKEDEERKTKYEELLGLAIIGECARYAAR